MTDKRMLHKKIWDCEQFLQLTLSERLLYIGLITWSDDEGAFRADPAYWKRKIFHSDRIGKNQIEQKLKKIEKLGLIITGDTEKGVAGCHPNWFDHQTLRVSRSKPSQYSELLVANGLPTMFQYDEQGKLIEVMERDEITEDKFATSEICEDEKDPITNYKDGRRQMLDNWTNRPKKLDNN